MTIPKNQPNTPEVPTLESQEEFFDNILIEENIDVYERGDQWTHQ